MSKCDKTMPGHHRLVFTVALAAALIVSVGVLGPSATAANASLPKLSARLLSIGQMPTGWSVDNSTGGSGVGCLAHVLEPKGIKQTAKAGVYFEDNGNVPEVSEALATFTNATAAFKKMDANLTACKHLSGKSDGQKVTGTLGQMSFPHYGNASAAFAASFTTQGMTLAEDQLIVRKGTIVMGIREGNLNSVNVSQFQGFVKKAVAKVR